MSAPNPYQLSVAPVTDAQRDAVAQVLSAHFANDHLTIDTLDARMAMVYEATTHAQLEAALAGLDMVPKSAVDPGVPARIVDESLVPKRAALLAVMGGFEAKGAWVVPRQLKLVAFMGGGELDLREAKFGPGVTEIDVFFVMGGAEIIVPPGVRVEMMGGAVMGGFGLSGVDESALTPDAPVLRVGGMCIMGGMEVKVRGPTKKMLKRYEEALQRIQSGLGRRRLPPG